MIILLKSDHLISLFNSSRRPMLYVVYFTVPHREFYQQKNRSAILVWAKKQPRMHKILHFTNFFYCVSVTTTTPWPALHYPPPSIHTDLQQCCGNSIAMILQGTTGEVLPTFYKGVIYSIPY